MKLIDRCKLEGVELPKKIDDTTTVAGDLVAEGYNAVIDLISNLQVPEPREALDKKELHLILCDLNWDCEEADKAVERIMARFDKVKGE